MTTSEDHAIHLPSQWRGTCLVALSGMFYGVIGYFATQLFHAHFTVSAMLFWRFFIAMIWILLCTLLSKRNIFQYQSSHPVLIKTIFLGVMSYSGGSAFYFMASKHIGTGIAMVIFFSFPVFVTLFAWILSNWRMNKHALASLTAVIIGLILLKGYGDNELDLNGILFAILSALCYAIYVYGSQHSAKMIDSRLLTLLICLGNSLLFLIISCSTKSFIIPSTLSAWIYICVIGVIATALPIQLVLDGLKYISPVKASILSVLEPVVTVCLGLVFLNETMSYTQSIGVIIVLFGALLIQFEKTPNTFQRGSEA